MIGKLLTAYLGSKLMARSGRGAAGALGGLATAAVARRGVGPLAMVVAAGYGLKKLNEYRNRSRTTTASK